MYNKTKLFWFSGRNHLYVRRSKEGSLIDLPVGVGKGSDTRICASKQVFLFLLTSTLLFGCSKDDDDAPSTTSPETIFQFIISSGPTTFKS